MSEPIRHSPGPWKANGDHVVVDKDGNYVAGTYSLRVFEDVTPNNLRLIAEAPEMYRILCQICNQDQNWGVVFQGPIVDAQTLLKKLEGEK